MKLLKKSILLALVAPLLFSLLSFTNAVAGEGKVVTIRVYETGKTIIGPPKIYIIEEGKTRIIEIERYKMNVPEPSKNLETLNGLLEQYYKAGLKIEDSNSVFLTDSDTQVTTYILTK